MKAIVIAPSREAPRPHVASESPRRAADVEWLAKWMDTVFTVPGLGIKFGLDAILGLLPVAGDTASAVAAMYILNAAHQRGVPRVTMARMALNVVLDLVVGVVPIVGDAFDVYWKANNRNAELLRRHLAAGPTAAKKLTRSDRVFVGLLLAGLFAVATATIVGTYFILAWVAGAVGQLFS